MEFLSTVVGAPQTPSLDSVKAFFSGEPAPPQSWSEQVSEQFSMSFYKRMVVFSGFFGLGVLFLFFSTASILSPTAFVKYYTFGNLFIIFSTFFLIGPSRQLKAMFEAKRIFSTLAYFGTMVAALYSALKLESVVLSTLCMLLQAASAIWYAASYVPFAQDCLHGTAKSILPI